MTENNNWAFHILVDAKTEYTKQIQDVLTPRLYEGVKSLYQNSCDICKKNNTNNKILITFQKLLKTIPKWNENILNSEYDRIVKKSQCDFLDELITAIFIAHMKVLTSIKISSKGSDKGLNIKVPKGVKFIHSIYVQVARNIWKNPYLFDHMLSTCDVQRNMRDSYTIIDNSIQECIRKQLPVKNILQECLEEDEIEEDDSDLESIISTSQRNNLKKILEKNNLNNLNNLNIYTTPDNEQLSPMQSPMQSQVHSPMQSQVHSPMQSQVHSPIQSQVHSPIQSPVQSQELRQLSPVQSPELRQLSPVQSPELRQLSPVQSPELRQLSPVQSQELRQLSPVQSQELRQLSPVQSQELRQLSPVQSTVVRNSQDHPIMRNIDDNDRDYSSSDEKHSYSNDNDNFEDKPNLSDSSYNLDSDKPNTPPLNTEIKSIKINPINIANKDGEDGEDEDDIENKNKILSSDKKFLELAKIDSKKLKEKTIKNNQSNTSLEYAFFD